MGPVWCLELNDHDMFTGGDDGTTRQWDINSGIGA